MENPTKPAKATLAQFVTANSQLITATAAFTALTALAIKMTEADAVEKAFVPGIPLMGALILTIELFVHTPPPPRHWRLVVFENVLAFQLLCIGGYWLTTFKAIWVPPVMALIRIVIVLGPLILFTHISSKGIALILNKDVSDPEVIRWSRIIFLCLLGAFALTVVLVIIKFGGQTVTITLPKTR